MTGMGKMFAPVITPGPQLANPIKRNQTVASRNKRSFRRRIFRDPLGRFRRVERIFLTFSRRDLLRMGVCAGAGLFPAPRRLLARQAGATHAAMKKGTGDAPARRKS